MCNMCNSLLQNVTCNFGYNGSSKNAVWPLKSSLDQSSNNYNGSSKADNPEWVGGRGTPVDDPARKIHALKLHYTWAGLHL